MTIVLFDVDHTLVVAKNSHRQAFADGFREIYGVEGDMYQVDSHGSSDLWIIKAVLRKLEVPEEVILERLVEMIAFCVRRFEELSQSEPPELCPGVSQLLATLRNLGVSTGLITGNLEGIAAEKMRIVDLSEYFPFGGFGESSEERSGILAAALAATKEAGTSTEKVFVVGDTPKDIAAAKANNVPSIAVASGDFSEKVLEKAGADYVLSSLENVEEFLRIIGEEV